MICPNLSFKNLNAFSATHPLKKCRLNQETLHTPLHTLRVVTEQELIISFSLFKPFIVSIIEFAH